MRVMGRYMSQWIVNGMRLRGRYGLPQATSTSVDLTKGEQGL